MVLDIDQAWEKPRRKQACPYEKGSLHCDGGRRKKILDFIIFLLCLQSYKEIKKYEKTFEYRLLFPMDTWF